MAMWLILSLLTSSILFVIVFVRARRRATVPTVGFFHPYADAGGGGERVLWHSVSAILKKWPTVHCAIIHGEKKSRTGDRILQKVKLRFGLRLPQERIKFIYLRSRFLVEASTWPRLTLIGQCIGSIVLGMEAILKCQPHILFDTMGYAFVYPLYRWIAGTHVASYVHYPIVSTEMLAVIEEGRSTFNNSNSISRSRFLTRLKVYYYRLLAVLYGFVGRRSDVTMVNSTWTYGHITELWKREGINIVYPPCDVESFSQVAHREDEEYFRIVSIGQYRPEKNQREQLKIIRTLLQRHPEKKPLLVMIGSCRDEGDHNRVEELRHEANKLNIMGSVQFMVNVSFSQLLRELELATVAIHTMHNEHFGISLVECMAAGCVMIAHRSGGPKLDIVIDKETGFLADTTEEFIDNICYLMTLSEEERELIAKKGAENAKKRFSSIKFEECLVRELEPIINYYVN